MVAEPTLLEEVITRKHRDMWRSIYSNQIKDPSYKSVRILGTKQEKPNSGGLSVLGTAVVGGLLAVGIVIGFVIARK